MLLFGRFQAALVRSAARLLRSASGLAKFFFRTLLIQVSQAIVPHHVVCLGPYARA